MLPDAHSLRKSMRIKNMLTAMAVALAGATSAYAQDSAMPGSGYDDLKGLLETLEQAKEGGASLQGISGTGVLSNVDAEELKRASQLGVTVVRDLLDAYSTRRTPEMEAFANDLRRRADSIADETLSARRDRVLDFLGIDPLSDSTVYIFLSWSMPIEVMRSYAIEAMWSGATLVFRGVPPGRELGDFILNDLRQLVYGKGAAANISLDPRLFDAYSVQTVPAIVYTTVRANMQCQGVEEVSVTLNDVTASYDRCPELPADAYWKISGAVTTSYALQAFIDDGAEGARTHLQALAKGWSQGRTPGKGQVAFTGAWEDVLSPSQSLPE